MTSTIPRHPALAPPHVDVQGRQIPRAIQHPGTQGHHVQGQQRSSPAAPQKSARTVSSRAPPRRTSSRCSMCLLNTAAAGRRPRTRVRSRSSSSVTRRIRFCSAAATASAATSSWNNQQFRIIGVLKDWSPAAEILRPQQRPVRRCRRRLCAVWLGTKPGASDRPAAPTAGSPSRSNTFKDYHELGLCVDRDVGRSCPTPGPASAFRRSWTATGLTSTPPGAFRGPVRIN